MALIFTLGAALLLFFWIFVGVRGVLGLKSAVHLTPDSPFPLPPKPPFVSILVPARNEAEIVGACIESLLAQDYPAFEIIAVDDDSTDGTGEILDNLVKTSKGRLRVLHVRGEIPPGWVGKHYALTLAHAQARGEWFLFSDADMIDHPQALSKAMGLASKKQADLVSLLPMAESVGFWERLVIPLWGVLLGVAFPVQNVNDPRKRNAIAAGGFILISRSSFETIGGYQPAADHIVDDVLLAKRIKDAGFRIYVAFGEQLSKTRMYSNLRDLWEGIEKSASAALDFRWWILGAALLFLFSNVMVPAAGMYGAILWSRGNLPVEWHVFTAIALVLGGMLLLMHALANLKMRIPLYYTLFAPLSYPFYATVMVSSFIKGRLGGGVEWKGRKYYGASKPLSQSKLEI